MTIAIQPSPAKRHLSVTSTLAIAALLVGGLSGCGHRPETRAVTGAGIGVVGAYVLGAPLLAGAAVGAVAGAVTTPDRNRNRDNRRDREDNDR